MQYTICFHTRVSYEAPYDCTRLCMIDNAVNLETVDGGQEDVVKNELTDGYCDHEFQ